jgi:hypothetical protein
MSPSRGRYHGHLKCGRCHDGCLWLGKHRVIPTTPRILGCFVVQSGVDTHQAQPHGEDTVSDMMPRCIARTRRKNRSRKDYAFTVWCCEDDLTRETAVGASHVIIWAARDGDEMQGREGANLT